MEAKIFVDKLYEKAKDQNLGEFQINYNSSTETEIKVFNQKVEDTSSNEHQKLSFDIKIGDHIGSFVTEVLEEDKIDEIILHAVENAKLIDDKDENFFHDGSGEYKKDLEPYKPLAKLKDLDVLEYLKKLESLVYEANPLIDKVMFSGFGQSKSRLIMKNSLGLDVSSERESAEAYVSLSAKKGEVTKTGFDFVNFSEPEHFDPEFVAKKAVEKTVSKLDAENLVSQKTKVVIKGNKFKSFLAKVFEAANAKNVQEGYSKFADMLNKKVAGSNVSIIEDPFIKGGNRTRAFDAEGFPTSYKEIIKDGVLNTYLYNLKTAHKEGVKSTGNAGGIRNAYLKPGEQSFDELIKEVNNGVFIDEINGLNSGFSLVSGDFSFVGEGFMIENGKITKPLNQFTISGNFYQMLLDIKKVANDLDFEFGSTGSPSVWVEGLNLADK